MTDTKRRRGPQLGDLAAGLSVAIVLIPQSLAYAELAGMPPYRGLYAAALPPLAAVFFASSPYLQTGPTAIVSLLTASALAGLAAEGSSEYVGLALLLAIMAGLIWVITGVLRAGAVAYLMSEPMLMGFIPAAALVILSTQLASAFGTKAPDGSALEEGFWALTHPGAWESTSIVLSVVVLILMLGGRRLHPLFPGVLVAVAVALGYSELADYGGRVVGEVPVELPPISLDLPWSEFGKLIVPALVITLVGFAEAGSIARTFAAMERERWDPNREFISQGVANLTAGIAGGFPVCGSFSRSSLNHISGARTRWAGAVTGLIVLAFLPFAALLEGLPKAVLAAIVIGAVSKLVRLGAPLRLWRYSRPQFAVAWVTFMLTLALSEQVEIAVMVGIALAIVIHLWRELKIDVQAWTEGEQHLHLRPAGVLWFGAAPALEDSFLQLLAEHQGSEDLTIHLDGLGRIDLTGALALRALVGEAREAGLNVTIDGVPTHARGLITEIVEREDAPLGGGHG